MATDIYQQHNDELDALFGDYEEEAGDNSAVDTPLEQSFTLPTEANDELSALLSEAGGGGGLNWDELNSRELEAGEKADDAVDYEDIGDDDSLPDEQPPQAAADGENAKDGQAESPSVLLPGIEDSALDGLDDDDDLFGPSSPILTAHEPQHEPPPTEPLDKQARDDGQASDLASEHGEDGTARDISMLQPDLDEMEDAEYRTQLALFAQSGKGYIPTTEQENIEEWLKLEFPSFKRDETPFFNKLFPPRPHKWPAKTPLKPPKPVRPSKVNLELEQDQKTSYNSAAPAVPEADTGLVRAKEPKAVEEVTESADESETDEQLPGGLTMSDLEFICADIDAMSHLAGSDDEVVDIQSRVVNGEEDFSDFDDFANPRKKRRLDHDPRNVVTIHQIDVPSLDNPEDKTAKLARKVVLDLNDPHLLVEEIDPEAAKAKARAGEKTTNAARTIKERLQQRFKTSNDAEYDLLKQNHQHKVRGQLTHLNIEHSVPALRLQYPYYQVRLSLQELRNYHRKKMHFKYPISFSPLHRRKKADLKGMKIEDIYKNTSDISMADNSSMLLLEYSEEHPLMLSQTGMGNKVVNYYRRRAKDDTSRPKSNIGETSVLLPEDKSPFYIFGQIDPGETITALYNSMYRAPIFPQDPKPTDFLVIRQTTGTTGQTHYLRNIENLYVAGQELPSAQVPGTHSRAVTTAAKNRLKAISFRIARRKKHNRLKVEEVTRHFPDTTDMQNRQKMKEFMVFNKEHKEWEMKPGETVPDEDAIRNLIKPEDICLLESMQVGAQYLQDAGYADNDDDDDKAENDNDSIEQQLAPWRTTKNFLAATQGKAMLRLYGEGDPSGRGEAFSFIKTSMKGGFRPIGGSAQDAITLKKELGGHSYNVARQQKSYEESIRNIWEKQKASLGSKIEPSDLDMDGDVDAQEDKYGERSNPRATPMSAVHTPAPSRRMDDETATSFSRRSVNSQSQRALKILRTVKRNGEEFVEEHIETDPAVIKQYMKIKEMEEAQSFSLNDIVPTGDAEYDARQRKRLEEELAKLEKNFARRKHRKNKNAAAATSPGGTAMSPDGDAGGGGGGGKNTQPTQRKCANCGQVGHIKTNKKLCPLLNGTIKQEDGFNNSAFMGAPPTMS
ncbi:Transcription initiation factor TFIID subunit 1 [Exophiala dermatitidis]